MPQQLALFTSGAAERGAKGWVCLVCRFADFTPALNDYCGFKAGFTKHDFRPETEDGTMTEREQTEKKMTDFLAALTDLSRMHGLGITVGVSNQSPTLFVLENDDCDDFNRTYRVDAEGRLFFD